MREVVVVVTVEVVDTHLYS